MIVSSVWKNAKSYLMDVGGYVEIAFSERVEITRYAHFEPTSCSCTGLIHLLWISVYFVCIVALQCHSTEPSSWLISQHVATYWMVMLTGVVGLCCITQTAPETWEQGESLNMCLRHDSSSHFWSHWCTEQASWCGDIVWEKTNAYERLEDWKESMFCYFYPFCNDSAELLYAQRKL